MSEPGFLAMAAAIRELAVSEAVTLDRLRAAGLETDDLRERNARAAAGAAVLDDLAAQEPIVREMIRVGALVDFPAYTPLMPELRPGMMALVRARVEEVHVAECRVGLFLETERMCQMAWVHRGDVVGIEKPRPEGAPPHKRHVRPLGWWR